MKFRWTPRKGEMRGRRLVPTHHLPCGAVGGDACRSPLPSCTERRSCQLQCENCSSPARVPGSQAKSQSSEAKNQNPSSWQPSFGAAGLGDGIDKIPGRRCKMGSLRAKHSQLMSALFHANQLSCVYLSPAIEKGVEGREDTIPEEP